MTAIRNLRWWIIGSLLVGIGIVVACAAYQSTWVQTYVEKTEADDRSLLERSESANKAFLEKSDAANRALLEAMDKRWQAINTEQQKRHDENMRELRSLHGK